MNSCVNKKTDILCNVTPGLVEVVALVVAVVLVVVVVVVVVGIVSALVSISLQVVC